MQDRYGRKIDYLRLSITDLCNYRCVYCMGSEGVQKKDHSDILSIEELISVGKAAVACGVKKIRITGGEPLVRKGLISLCKELKAIPGLEELALTTNGAMLKEMAHDLKEAGVDRINISLDTLKEKRFSEITRIGKLSDVLSGIDAAKDAGFSEIKINVVLLGGVNEDEIEDFAAFAKDHSVQVRFIELMPIGPCKNWDKGRFVSADVVLEKAPGLVFRGKEGVARIYDFDDLECKESKNDKSEGRSEDRSEGRSKEKSKGSIGLISPLSQCFCSECNRIRVTADGRLLPCLHRDLEYKLKGLSEDEMKKTMEAAIANKPDGHKMGDTHRSDNPDYMHQIGG